jgi:hypothetical protein
MRYALLINHEDKLQAEMSEAEAGAQMAGYAAFGEEMGARGVLQGGERLKPAATATTVRVREGDVLTSDGPFAETKEQLAGFYLVECKDLDEAIAVAAKIPGAAHGSIEVRPVWEM